METNNPANAIKVENKMPTGPTNRLIPKGGRKPPIFTIMA